MPPPAPPLAQGSRGTSSSKGIRTVLAALLLVAIVSIVGTMKLTKHPAIASPSGQQSQTPTTSSSAAKHALDDRNKESANEGQTRSKPLPKQANRPPAPTRSTSSTTSGGADGVTSYDVHKIISGEKIKEGKSFKQLHHGIYRVIGSKSNVQFALKTECRPPAKWHGQQGWSEVGVFGFTSLFFKEQPELNSVPPARGVTVLVTEAQARDVVHKDQCGVLRGTDTVSGAPPPDGYVELIGVALTWQSSHDDNALPSKATGDYFKPPSSSSSISSKKGALTFKTREYLSQISDVQVIDYILGNEDREDKNWFWNHPQEDATRKLIMMDNGWAFSGVLYQESICGNYDSMLKCPPLLRYFSKSKRCRSAGGSTTTASHENCRFRKETIDRLKLMLELWNNKRAGEMYSFGEAWRRSLATDPLVGWLLKHYDFLTDSNRATKPKKDGDGRFSMALARYVHSCPPDVVGLEDHERRVFEAAEKKKSATAGINNNHFGLPFWQGAESEENGEAGGDVAKSGGVEGEDVLYVRPDHPLLVGLSYGVRNRMEKLVHHVEDHCWAKFGESYVFG